MSFPYYAESDGYEEAAAEAELQRRAARYVCGACGLRGCHKSGCPEAINEELENEDE